MNAAQRSSTGIPEKVVFCAALAPAPPLKRQPQIELKAIFTLFILKRMGNGYIKLSYSLKKK
jgi:hypothetical protein